MADYKFDVTSAPGLRAEIGERLARLRLGRNETQQALAQEAGVAVRTLRRLEAGQPCSLDSFLRVALALGVADGFAAAVPSSDIRPIERATLGGTERRRARPVKGRTSEAPWTWGEESRD